MELENIYYLCYYIVMSDNFYFPELGLRQECHIMDPPQVTPKQLDDTYTTHQVILENQAPPIGPDFQAKLLEEYFTTPHLSDNAGGYDKVLMRLSFLDMSKYIVDITQHKKLHENTQHMEARRDPAVINQLSADMRRELGHEGRTGIRIVVGDFTGRTPFSVFLSGLARGEFVIPKQEWEDFGLGDKDHDDEFHFDRMPEIHPDTAAAIQTYATVCSELLAKFPGGSDGTDLMGDDLDIILSIVGRVGDIELPRRYEAHTPRNKLRRIFKDHYFRTVPGATVENVNQYAQTMVVQQIEYEREVKSRVKATQGKDASIQAA